MKSEKQQRAPIIQLHKGNNAFLQKFRLYETRSNFYMIGRDKHRSIWRVLKIDRLDTSKLNITEDSTTYTEIECCDLLRRIDDGNKSTGGLKFVTTCYGIVGFIKFLGPYYLLLITKRRQIGVICGHAVYAISKSEMIPIPNSTVRSNVAYSKNENRSFVNSACKCKMYLVLLRRCKQLEVRTTCCPLYLGQHFCSICRLLFSSFFVSLLLQLLIYCFWLYSLVLNFFCYNQVLPSLR